VEQAAKVLKVSYSHMLRLLNGHVQLGCRVSRAFGAAEVSECGTPTGLLSSMHKWNALAQLLESTLPPGHFEKQTRRLLVLHRQ
jgi:hypothetical protein